MPFTALYKEKTINSLTIDNGSWNELKTSKDAQQELKCPDCEGGMQAKAGIGFKVAPHFAHITDPQGCSLLSESKEHLYLKQRVFEVCHSLGIEAETEKRIETDGETRIADVCMPKKNKIIEIQLSGQSDSEYYERDNWYRRAGYETLWITWKSWVARIAIAQIRIRSDNTLLNKKEGITTADELYLVRDCVDFQETPYSQESAYHAFLDEKRVEISELIENFLLQKESYIIDCEVYNQWHWCGEVCRNSKERIVALSEEQKEKRIAFMRKHLTPQLIFYPDGRCSLDESFIDEHLREIQTLGLIPELKEAILEAEQELLEAKQGLESRQVEIDFV